MLDHDDNRDTWAGQTKAVSVKRTIRQQLVVKPSNVTQPLSYLPFSALTLLVWRQEGHPACKKTGWWFVDGDDLAGALHVLQLQLSPPPPPSCFNKIQIGDILVPANLGPP